MSKVKFNPRTLILLLFIIVIAGARVIAPMLPDFVKYANYTAVGAISLFAGAYFTNNFKAFGFPLIALVASDLLLSVTFYKGSSFLYEGWYWTYIAFILMVLAGKILMTKITVANFLAGAIAVVFIHWIVTDLGTFMSLTIYPRTLGGFWSCLVAAIPFEGRFLTGTLIYGAIMFGAFEALKSRYPSLQLKKVKA